MSPLVSVITPTWQRHDLLLDRCMPSVQAQTYPDVEHVIVSDGPDPDLQLKMRREFYTELRRLAHRTRFYQLPEHVPDRWGGSDARNRALWLAEGELIAYLDDDDSYRPDHIQILADTLMRNPDAGFAWSRAIVARKDGKLRVGDGPPAHGRIIGCMVMHRREILKTATWRHHMRADDWDLVERWLQAGIPWVSVDAETVDYYPAEPLTGTPAAYPPYAPQWSVHAGRRYQ